MGSILITIVIFALIIFVHECGHFIAAKLCGVQVNEFALGMGPTLLKKKVGETVYALRLFPIGGFVSMEGEDDSSDNERAFCNKKLWQRFVILVAGAAMNLVLGFFVILSVVASEDMIATNQIALFSENAVTEESGLQVGDVIQSINGRRILVETDIIYELSKDADGVVSMVVLRDGEEVTLPAVTFAYSETEEGNVLNIDFKVVGVETNFGNVLSYTARKTLSTARLIWISIADLFTGRASINDLSGPVGITQVVGEATSYGFSTLLSLLSFITINVGIFNLLPIPALDGGRLIFLLIEAVRGKPIKPEHEGLVHLIGFVLVILLFIFVTIKDIRNLFA